jgi:hypothetical protein
VGVVLAMMFSFLILGESICLGERNTVLVAVGDEMTKVTEVAKTEAALQSKNHHVTRYRYDEKDWRCSSVDYGAK